MSRTGEVSDPGLLDRMRWIFSLDEETVSRDIHPDFNRYFRHVLRSPGAFDKYVAEVRYLKAVGGLRGHVLDLAAGFGITALCLRTVGIASVSCLDLVETKTTTARKLVALAQASDVDIRRGDATIIPFGDETFDAVLIKDAASHFRSPERVYGEAFRVLRIGGRLTILDDRNALNEACRTQVSMVWETSETGSPTELARLGMQTSFTQMRRDYIARQFPNIDQSSLTKIADQTRGYTYRMLDQAVPEFLERGTLTVKPVAPCINPENEIVQEQLINPLELCQKLRRIGFEARVLPAANWDPAIRELRGQPPQGMLRRMAWATWPTHKLWPKSVQRMVMSRMTNFIVAGTKR